MSVAISTWIGLLREWISPSRELTIRTHLSPSEVRENLEAATTFRSYMVLNIGNGWKLPPFKGKIKDGKARLSLRTNVLSETDSLIRIELVWMENEAGGTDAKAKIRVIGQGYPFFLVWLFFVVAGYIVLPDFGVLGFPMLLFAAFATAVVVMLAGGQTVTWFPKWDLHLAAERLAPVFGIGYGDLRNQNMKLLE